MNSSKLNAVVTNLLEQYLAEGAWNEARQLVHDERFQKCCLEDGSEILNLLMQKMTVANFDSHPELYNTAEVLLKATTELGNPQDMAMEFLDLLDNVTSDTVLISLMKGLKVVLLRQPEKKALTMEMCLAALLRYFKGMEGPAELENRFVVEKCPFLESNEEVSRILQVHLILLLFLEPIVKLVLKERSEDHNRRTLENTRQNVLIHFLLNILETDLNRIYVPFEATSETNTYIRQCREGITRMLTDLLGNDPFFLLQFVERRIRYPIEEDENALGLDKMNVFILPNKVSILAYGHFFHTFLVHVLAPENLPKIYTKEFIFIRFTYLITEMLRSEDENVQMKALELGQSVLQAIGGERADECLELTIFETFFDRMIQLMTYSENENIRRHAVKYAEAVILSFNGRGRMIILENLFKEYAENKGLNGYLPILYKNMVVQALNATTTDDLAAEYSGKHFQKMLLKYICNLPEAEKTNILDCSDRILAALNLIRFIALRDRDNRTSFWDVKKEVTDRFLDKLRLAIDLSRAHYQQYKKNIEDGIDVVEENKEMSVSMFGGAEMPELSQEQKLMAMNNCLNSFDLMDSLLARVNECIQVQTGK